MMIYMGRNPDAPAPKMLYKCQCCGEGIIDGDEFAELYDGYYHVDCMESMSIRELLRHVSITVKEAREEDAYGIASGY